MSWICNTKRTVGGIVHIISGSRRWQCVADKAPASTQKICVLITVVGSPLGFTSFLCGRIFTSLSGLFHSHQYRERHFDSQDCPLPTVSPVALDFFFSNCGLKAHTIKFTILTTFRVQFSSVKCIYPVVQPSPPSFSRTFSSCKNERPYPLN